MSRRWTDEERQTLVEMRERECSLQEVAARLNRTKKSCSAEYSRICTHLKKTADTDELAKKIRSFIDKGVTEEDIALKLGISRYMVRRIKIMYKFTLTSTQQENIIRKSVTEKVYCIHPDLRGRRDTICWACKKALRGCEKPVDGFVAKKIPYYGTKGIGISYIVSECPNYDEEDWYQKYRDKGVID